MHKIICSDPDFSILPPLSLISSFEPAIFEYKTRVSSWVDTCQKPKIKEPLNSLLESDILETANTEEEDFIETVKKSAENDLIITKEERR